MPRRTSSPRRLSTTPVLVLCLLAARHDDDVARDRERARMGGGVAADRAPSAGIAASTPSSTKTAKRWRLSGSRRRKASARRVRGVEQVAREDHRQIIVDGETLDGASRPRTRDGLRSSTMASRNLFHQSPQRHRLAMQPMLRPKRAQRQSLRPAHDASRVRIDGRMAASGGCARSARYRDAPDPRAPDRRADAPSSRPRHAASVAARGAPARMRPLATVTPAVTCSVQATFMTGAPAARARHRRQRLVLPRPDGGLAVAAVEPAGRRREDLGGGQAARSGLHLRQAVLVVQHVRERTTSA